MGLDTIITAVILATLGAIIYALRVLVILERRIERMDENLQKITLRVAQEELSIEKEEKKIEAMVTGRRFSATKPRRVVKKKVVKKAAKKPVKNKTVKKKPAKKATRRRR